MYTFLTVSEMFSSALRCRGSDRGSVVSTVARRCTVRFFSGYRARTRSHTRECDYVSQTDFSQAGS
jgi:hypothetical protein